MPGLRTRQELAGCSHRGAVVGLVWTECGRYLLSVGGDNTVRRWDSITGRNIKTNFPRLASVGKHPVDLVVTSGGDRDSVFVGEKAAVRVFDIQTGREGRKLTGHYSTVTCLAYNQSRLELYSGGRDKHILLWSPSTSTDSEDQAAAVTRDTWTSSEEES